MTEHDIRTAFGETPASFRDQVDQTLMQLEDEPAKKRYKFTTVLALAALITVLLAGAAVAATQLKLTEYLRFSLPDDPDDTVHTNVAVLEDENIRCEIEEVMYDGYGLAIQLKLTNLKPDQHSLVIDGNTQAGTPNPALIPLQCSINGFIYDADCRNRSTFLIERTAVYGDDGTITVYASDFSHSYYHGLGKTDGYREKVCVEFALTYSQPSAADTMLTASFALDGRAAALKYSLAKRVWGEFFEIDSIEIVHTGTMGHYDACIYVRDAFIDSDTQKPNIRFSLITPDGTEYPITVFRLDVDHTAVNGWRGLHLSGVLPAIADMPDTVFVAMRDAQTGELIEQTECSVSAADLLAPPSFE